MKKYVLSEKEARDAYVEGIVSPEEFSSYEKWVTEGGDPFQTISVSTYIPTRENFYLTISALDKFQKAGLVYEDKPNDRTRYSPEQVQNQAGIILDKMQAKIDSFESNPLDIIRGGATKVEQSHIDTFVNNMKVLLQQFDKTYELSKYQISDKGKELQARFEEINKRLDVIKSSFLGYQQDLSEARVKKHEYDALKAEYDQMSPLKKMVSGKKKKEMEQMRKESLVGMFDDYLASKQNEQQVGREL